MGKNLPKTKTKKRKKENSLKRLVFALFGFLIIGFLLFRIINYYLPKDGLVKPPGDINQTEFSSDKDGYSISYPKDWTTDTSYTIPADISRNKTDTINVAIQRLVGDPRLLSRTGITPVMKELKDSYSINKDYTVDSLEGTTWRGLPVLQVKGKFTEKGTVWNFEEYAIFFGSEMYNLRANWKNDNEKAVIQPIISSFRINGYDSRDDEGANKALASVLDLSEVRNFQKDVIENNQSKFSIFIDSSPPDEPQLAVEPYYVVAVVEFFPDHRTTFNRYRIGKNDGKVYRYDVVNDRWDKI